MKALVSLLIAFSFAALAQDSASVLSANRGTVIKTEKKFSASYNMISRNLEDTDYAENLRDTQDIVLPTELDFEIHVFGLRYQHTDRMAFEVAGSYMRADINLQGNVVVATPRADAIKAYNAAMKKREAAMKAARARGASTGRPAHTTGRPAHTMTRSAHQGGGHHAMANANPTRGTRSSTGAGRRSGPPRGAVDFSSVPEKVVVPLDIDATSEGLSDTRVGVLYDFVKNEANRLTVSTHVSIPTGSIEESSITRSGNDVLYSYSGQLGSGTYDIRPKVAYKYSLNHGNGLALSAGTDLEYILRTGRNDQNYRMGNQTIFNAYAGYTFFRAVGLFMKGRLRDWRDTSDFRLTDPSYTAEEKLRIETDPYVESGTRWEVLATTRVAAPLPWKLGFAMLEAGVPVYRDQRSGDVQLETEWYLNATVVASF